MESLDYKHLFSWRRDLLVQIYTDVPDKRLHEGPFRRHKASVLARISLRNIYPLQFPLQQAAWEAADLINGPRQPDIPLLG
jgi:hypothetical protein